MSRILPYPIKILNVIVYTAKQRVFLSNNNYDKKNRRDTHRTKIQCMPNICTHVLEISMPEKRNSGENQVDTESILYLFSRCKKSFCLYLSAAGGFELVGKRRILCIRLESGNLVLWRSPQDENGKRARSVALLKRIREKKCFCKDSVWLGFNGRKWR